METFQYNLDSIQLVNKLIQDSIKVVNINEYIQNKNWQWIANITNKSNQYYKDKKDYFGDIYNMLGIDYYCYGVYHNVKLEQLPLSETTSLPQSFDWREKHDAHLSNSKYWDGNLDNGETGNGWMTGIRNQGSCGSCSAFGTIGAFEAYINLYYNFHADSSDSLRLSERDVFNCSQSTGIHVGCSCATGKYPDKILNYIKYDGVVDETCYPQGNPFCEVSTNATDCSSSSKCPSPDYHVRVEGYRSFNFLTTQGLEREEFIKRKLLEHGPLVIEVGVLFSTEYTHAITLVGYDKSNGQTVWIMKNSWGTGLYGDGYVEAHLFLGTNQFIPCIYNKFYSFDNGKPEMLIIPSNPPPSFVPFETIFCDRDKDGYWNWGLNRDSYTTPCDQQQDWNDNNNRIGQADENYNGIAVKPTMDVYLGHPNFGRMIENTGFCHFHDNDLSADDELSIYIKNTGTAQLNLSEFNPIVELLDEYTCYTPNLANLNNQICHLSPNNLTRFDITFSCVGS